MRLRLSICASLVLLLIPILTYSTPAINKQLRIRGGIDSPPYEFINEDGQPDGFNVELIKALMSTLDLDYDLQLDELTAIRQQLDSGEIDLIIGLLYSEKRTQTIAFSLPHNYIYQTVVTRKDSPFRSIKDLRGKSVFVQEHGRAEEAMHEFGLNDELVPVKNIGDGLQLLAEGKHDAIVCNNVIAYKVIKELGLTGLKVHSPREIPPMMYCIAAKNSNKDLILKINNGLQQLKANGQYDKIYNKWLSVYEEHPLSKYILIFLYGALAIAAISIIFIITLRNRVLKATQKIRKQHANIEAMHLENELLMRTLPVGIIVFDNNENVIFINDYVADMLQMPHKSRKSAILADFINSNNIYSHFGQANCSIESTRFNAEYGVRNANGEQRTHYYYCRLQKSTARNDQPKYVLIIVDITDSYIKEQKLQQSNIELKKAKDRAERSDMLKSAFVANMSHEIRTPLNAIVGFSSMMFETDEKNDQLKFLKIINANSDLLLKLIGDILDLSKIEAGYVDLKYETFNANELVQELYSSLKERVMDPDIEFNLNIPSTDCYICTDKNRFAQVLTNFATNAIKFTKHGYIEVGFSQQNGGIKLYVTDTGIGIATDEKQRVFDRFYKQDMFSQGTGLGMAISKAITDACNGQIGFESEVGKGSTFWAWFPSKH